MKITLLTNLLLFIFFNIHAQNVGIGTSSPISKLHIVDNSNENRKLRIESDNTSGLISAYILNTSTNAGLELGHVNNFPTYGAIGENYIYSSGFSKGLNIISRNTTTGDGHISFHTSGDALTNATLFLSDDDKVGIQNESPSATLDVIGTFQLVDGTEGASKVLTSDAAGNASWQVPSGGAGTDDDWYEVGTTTAPNSINDDIFTQGSVGVGTATPTSKLHIVDNSANVFQLRVSTDNTPGLISILAENTVTNAGLQMGHVNSFPTYGASGENYIYSSGNSKGLNIISRNTTTGDGHISFHTSGDALTSATLSLSDNDRVGIGTESPNDLLHVYQGSGNMGVRIETNTNTASDYAALRFNQGTQERGVIFTHQNDIYINSSSTTAGDDVLLGVNQVGLALGNVGIGTTTPTQKLEVAGGDIQLGNNKGVRFYNNSGTSGTVLRFDSNNDVVLGDFNNVFNGHVIFLTDGTQKMIVRNSGNVGIGTNSPTALLSVNGSANKTGGGSWAVFSDARLKKNVNSYTDGLSTLLQIETKTFQYNGKAGIQDTEKEYVGIIAQDMQKIAPYMVREVNYNNDETGEKDTYLEFDPSALDFMLVNAVKEMNETMKEMKERITALEEENKALKNLTKN